MEIILAQPKGFCAGVERAIDIVERAIKIYGIPLFVRHEIVHNKYVVEDLKSKGVIFINDLEEVPKNSIVIFSAHGVSKKVEHEAKKRNLNIIDATCPLVTKVHKEAQRNEDKGKKIILIGHKGHPEVEGTSGQVKQEVILVESVKDVDLLNIADSDNLSYVTQTTLSVDDTKQIIGRLKFKFPNITGPDTKDICYATQNRQDAVRQLAPKIDLLLVIGAKNSSNSNRLRDLGEEIGTKSYLIDDASKIDIKWLDGIKKVGITAGASAPEILTSQVCEFLQSNFPDSKIKKMEGIQENVRFKLPKEVIF